MKIVDTGFLGRGVAGTERAVISFPGVVSLSNGTLLATYRTGSEKDSPDETIEVCRSSDTGRTWDAPRRCFDVPTVNGKHGSLKVCFLTEIEPGHVMAGAMWVDRETYPGESLFNLETEGCLPMAILLADSHDFGETWSEWRVVPLPDEVGPPSLTSPIFKLPDGTLAISIETNKQYNDSSKWYQKVVYFHSTDGGQTWGEAFSAGFDPTGRIFNWDQRGAVAPDGRIVTFTWTYDTETQTYLNIHRRLSSDGGRTWSPAEDIGVTDQAAHPAILPDGRIVLAWVDRFKTHSIRARLASSIEATFDPSTEVVIYSHGTARPDDADELGALGGPVWTYGLPFAEALPDGDVLVLYYAGSSEDAMDVCWARLSLD